MIVRYLGESDPVALINGKEYECLGEENGLYRIIDEEGIDPDEELQGYLYSKENFEIVESEELGGGDNNGNHQR